jgi:iron complex transport system substrate-binding protein
MLKKLMAAALALALAVCLAACGRPGGVPSQAGAATKTITDALGRQVVLPQTVNAIVPLGNTPRMITYLGLAEKVVGYSGMDPESLTPLTAYAYVNRELWKELPRVGTDAMGNTDYYPEQIVLVQPDVILCTYPEDVVRELEAKTGVPVVAVGQGTLFGEDYDQALRILGEACGAEARAEAVIAFIDDCLADLEERTAGLPEEGKPSVLSAAATFKGAHGIEGVRPNDPVLAVVHARNIASGSAAGGASAVEVDKEQILAWDPDYIFCDYGGVALVKQDAREHPDYYAGLKAYRGGRIYQYPSSTSYFSNVEISLANCYFIGSLLYPEQFAGVDFEEKCSEIFEFFLGADDYLSVLEAYGARYGAVGFGEP